MHEKIADLYTTWIRLQSPLRFGQFAYNKLNLTDTSIYYETDNKKAYLKLTAKLTKTQSNF
jgi:hypothetical protein